MCECAQGSSSHLIQCFLLFIVNANFKAVWSDKKVCDCPLPLRKGNRNALFKGPAVSFPRYIHGTLTSFELRVFFLFIVNGTVLLYGC
ncbi:hypothetical protein GDO86_015355 [Hymenochirus boettgeri]|uniref:Secreted protein n=1 Tax=Hymenochirus boettgeri TaxID=247094 RepID=A0A8T2JXI9_9PIPI|nr:hypothetical protein GDO86_015355 [Hymenochirus boettgeri]